MIEMLPAMSSYTEEEAQEFGARTEHVSKRSTKRNYLIEPRIGVERLNH